MENEQLFSQFIDVVMNLTLVKNVDKEIALNVLSLFRFYKM